MENLRVVNCVHLAAESLRGATAALAVLAAVAIAGYAPASRASNVDPIATLRTE